MNDIKSQDEEKIKRIVIDGTKSVILSYALAAKGEFTTQDVKTYLKSCGPMASSYNQYVDDVMNNLESEGFLEKDEDSYHLPFGHPGKGKVDALRESGRLKFSIESAKNYIEER